MIFPICINGLFNWMIFFRVRSSTRRIQALAEVNNSTPVHVNDLSVRDIRLLKHIVFIFVVSVIGWTPIHVVSLTGQSDFYSQWFFFVFQLLPVFSSLVNVLDLFWFNHDLRQYLKEKCFNGLHRVRCQIK